MKICHQNKSQILDELTICVKCNLIQYIRNEVVGDMSQSILQ